MKDKRIFVLKNELPFRLQLAETLEDALKTDDLQEHYLSSNVKTQRESK